MNIHSKVVALIILLSLVFYACEDDLPGVCQEGQQLQYAAIRGMVLECKLGLNNISFSGRLNGQPICYYEGEDGYEAQTNRISQTITAGPTLSPNTPVLASGRYLSFGVIPIYTNAPDVHLKECIVVQTPLLSSDSSWNAIARKHLKKGALPLQSDIINEREGFNVVLEIPYHVKGTTGYYTIGVETLGGKQDDSRLEIVALEYEEAFGWGHYHIVMEMECNLYMRSCQIGVAGRRAFRLTQGRLEMVVSVPL